MYIYNYTQKESPLCNLKTFKNYNTITIVVIHRNTLLVLMQAQDVFRSEAENHVLPPSENIVIL